MKHAIRFFLFCAMALLLTVVYAKPMHDAGNMMKQAMPSSVASANAAHQSQQPVKKFTVVAYRYGFSPSKIVVNQGDLVKIKLTSKDVVHGFYIKAYNINVPAKKGKYASFKFVANKKGTFPIICSIYCGPGHRDMRGTLVVK